MHTYSPESNAYSPTSVPPASGLTLLPQLTAQRVYLSPGACGPVTEAIGGVVFLPVSRAYPKSTALHRPLSQRMRHAIKTLWCRD